jgi:hypothetical protein
MADEEWRLLDEHSNSSDEGQDVTESTSVLRGKANSLLESLMKKNPAREVVTLLGLRLTGKLRSSSVSLCVSLSLSLPLSLSH